MEELIRYKYDIINIFSGLSLGNHTTTKGFWDYCNDTAILTFKKNNYTFKQIIESGLCHFCAPHGSPNKYACKVAQNYDNESFNKIIKLDNFNNINEIDTDFVSSYHYIYCTYILKHVCSKSNGINVFEIGGGWGNMRRLLSNVLDINSYTIFDIDSTLYFNKTFYNENHQNYCLFENKEYTQKGYYNIGLNFRDTFITNYNLSIDFLIATHSLSELDMNEFCWYFNNIIKKCKYFLYCTQIKDSDHNPVSGDISLQKINMIKKVMETIVEIGQPGQEEDCKLFIFKLK